MLPLASFLLAALLGQSSLSSSDPLPCVAAQVRAACPVTSSSPIDGAWPSTCAIPTTFRRSRRPVRCRCGRFPRRSQRRRARVLGLHRARVLGLPDRLRTAARRRPARAEDRGRGHVGLVFMPGCRPSDLHAVRPGKASGQVALEFRGTQGGARVRLAGEYTAFGKIGELSFKYDLLDGFFLRPFLAVGGGSRRSIPIRSCGRRAAAPRASTCTWRATFLERRGEAALLHVRHPGRGARAGRLQEKQTSLFVGMGFYFFK